jgi:hypothetical protein
VKSKPLPRLRNSAKKNLAANCNAAKESLSDISKAIADLKASIDCQVDERVSELDSQQELQRQKQAAELHLRETADAVKEAKEKTKTQPKTEVLPGAPRKAPAPTKVPTPSPAPKPGKKAAPPSKSSASCEASATYGRLIAPMSFFFLVFRYKKKQKEAIITKMCF